MTKSISPTFIKNVKKSAKKLKKELNINHSEALELVSKDAGFSSFHALQKTFNNQIRTEINHVHEVRKFLIKIVEGDHGTSVIKYYKSTLSKYHDTADIKPKILTKILDVFDNGVNHDGQNARADLALLAHGFDNETIKEAGHRILKEDDVERKIKGNLLVALGHFFRSVHDCFQSQRFVHPSFEVYLADWVRSLRMNEEKVNKIMRELYVANDYVGFKNGSTYWKPLSQQSN
jgi:hypothetical protein